MAQEDSSPDPSPSPPNLSDPSKPDPPPPSSSSSSSSSLSRNVSFSRLNAQAPEFVPTQQQAPRLAAAASVPPPPPPPPPMHSFPPPPPPPPFHVAAAIQGHVAVPPHVIPVQHPHHVPVQYHPHHPHHPHPHPHHHHQQFYGGGGGGGGGFREQEVGAQVQNQAPVESDHVVAAASSASAKNKISEEATQKILNQRGAFPLCPTQNGLIFMPLTFELPLSPQLQEVDIVLHKATDEILSIELKSRTNFSNRIVYTNDMQGLQRSSTWCMDRQDHILFRSYKICCYFERTLTSCILLKGRNLV